MRRKIIKNKHQYKVNLPIKLLRKLNWTNSPDIKFIEVNTQKGKGILILQDEEEVMKLRLNNNIKNE